MSKTDQAKPAQLTDVAVRHQSAGYDGATGIYFLCLDGTVVYVGRSVNMGRRVYGHGLTDAIPFDDAWYLDVPREQLAVAEMAFIDHLLPAFNRINVNTYGKSGGRLFSTAEICEIIGGYGA